MASNTNNNIPLITTDTLQYRLDTQNFGKNGGQRGSLTRCAQKYGSLRVALCSDTMDAEAIETSKDDLVREVELFNLEMTKLIALQRNLEVQAKRNQLAEIEREQEIKEAQEQTRKSRELANKSIQRSNCLSEYESLARVIYENHPTSSTELQTQIDEIRSEISKLEDEIASKDETLRIREAQYRSLIQCMLDLKQTLMEDEENKNLEVGDSKSMESRNADRPQPMETDDLYGDLI